MIRTVRRLTVACLLAACASPEWPDRRDPAEQIARQWFNAITARDSEKLAAISHDPFFFDDATPVTGPDILRMYRLPAVLDGVRGRQSAKMTASTVAAYRAATGDEKLDSLARALSLKDDDYIVETDSSAVFVRFIDGQPRILAYWD
jgi:hypothetical protein